MKSTTKIYFDFLRPLRAVQFVQRRTFKLSLRMASPFFKPSDPVISASYQCLNGKVVLVTGSNSGIGAATALAFIKNGAQVALHARSIEQSHIFKDFCLAEGAKESQLFCVGADVTKTKEVQKIVEDTVGHFGRLDVLINNAGASVQERFENSNVENLDFMYNVNSRSVYDITKCALPHLKETKGNIVVVSAGLSLIPGPGCIDYAMSKAMADMFAKSLALDMAKEGVRVNIVNPGGIRTTVLKSALDSPETTETDLLEEEEESWKNIARIHPLGRTGYPEEVAEAVLFLASDVGSFITGHQLVIDGGATLTSSCNFTSPADNHQ